ncbi:MAG: DNA polymerase III subunit delta [Prevotellaceae bacterium]|jgi:DNA polymerase-3 subunit delta|nr:DNA polymerase III subunit delta [Prevotellaceae bacterium]
MAAKELTYDEICRDIIEKKFSPVYFLMGEEPYFIDKIEELLINNVLTEDERIFNQMIYYGQDTKVENIMASARRFPMMSKYQLVVIKEAQELNKIDLLSFYMKKPVPSTILVICHKYKKLDGRKSVLAETKKIGVVFESKKKYDSQMPAFIVSFVKKEGLDIDAKSAQMLSDYLGNDISRLAQEVEKLKIVLNETGTTKITPEIIEKNIGISKDYNSYELVNAIANKDILRANRIADYFDKNQKANPIQKVLSTLFDYFTNLMICLYSSDKTERGVMKALNLQWSFHAADYLAGLRNYAHMKVFNTIHEIRLADAASKGFENNSIPEGDIYKELLYKIMH